MPVPTQNWDFQALDEPDVFKCTFENCDKVFENAKDLRRHKVNDINHHYCKKCDLDFASDTQHIIHRIATPSKHITCPLCATDFKVRAGLDRHCEVMHPTQQQINCIACKGVFGSMASMMDHIQKGQCKISSEEWHLERAERTLQKEAFLERRDQNIGSHLSSRSSDLDVQDGGVSLLEHSNVTKLNDDAALAEIDNLASRISNLTTANGTEEPLGGKDSVVGNASSVAANDASMLSYNSTIDTSLSAHRKTTFKLIDFYDKVSDSYTCPVPRCKRVFKDPRDFHKHLLGPAHTGGRVQCPSCLKDFSNLTALCSHMESFNRRCKIKHSVNYNQVLRELTAGVVGTGGFHDDGSVKYIMPTDEGWDA
ncbi:uncharacterized protein AB675_4291 [Cyphellophora attinorum]|uniref:C2H2-type domain-containing protein n=1 Tax=Cyphellophora attinorum TaxID=1664694 RepID=A0A0N1HMK5_9EURO|nr:uncharacterized protein AB675_4291 [Phialophora attinorum]KPI38527.1 hypothetical protein AB675_4291 [Phialophora attinorum]